MHNNLKIISDSIIELNRMDNDLKIIYDFIIEMNKFIAEDRDICVESKEYFIESINIAFQDLNKKKRIELLNNINNMAKNIKDKKDRTTIRAMFITLLYFNHLISD